MAAGFYLGELPDERFNELTPVLFAAADAGDAIACRLIDQQANEIVAMALSAMRNLGLDRIPTEVVLACGVLKAENHRLMDGIEQGLTGLSVRLRLLTDPPIVGAMLLCLEHLGIPTAPLDHALRAAPASLNGEGRAG